MAREFSETVRAVLDAQAAEVHDLLIITLPKMPGDAEALRFYLATADIVAETVEYGERQFQPHVKSIGQISNTLGASPDNASCVIQNVDGYYGTLMNQTSRTLDGAECVVFRTLLTGATDTGYESEELFRGYIKDVKVDEETVKFTVIGETSRKGAMVGGDPVTQNCANVFNANGSGIGPRCGWTPAQGLDVGASASTCDLTPDGRNGCKAHHNRWRYRGVKPPNTENIRVGPPQRTPFGDYDPELGGYPRGGFPRWNPRIDPDYLARMRRPGGGA